MKRILINSNSTEETRIATLDNGKLIDLDIENADREQKKANIYKGYISRIEPSLNAIFVNYGEDKNGFLPFKEVSEYYLKDSAKGENIAHLLSEGQELLVQIDKEERGDKGAALTTFITLAGSYMVLLPNNPGGGGISRRVEGEDREKLKKYLKDLNIPKTMNVIARTACVECSFEELKHDFDALVELWHSIYKTYHKIKRASLLHKESDIIVRTVRDHLKEDVKEIIIDNQECYNDVKRQLKLLRQSFDVSKVKLYSSDVPLFAQHGIDQQIENAYKREIRLPSGGSIVIDTTEALVAIDVNSSRANKAEDVETTAFKTNMEAAEEVARQLRIRDLGGLVIIDFIDMSFFTNRKQVEELLTEVLQKDKARIQMSRISKLGLVEISRQRLSASINESVMQKCPRCEGHGFIKTTQATALTILRKIRAEAMKDDTNEIRVQVPVDIAAYILNEKRDSIIDIETKIDVKVMIIPNFNMESPKFQMQRIWGSSYKSNRVSSDLIEEVSKVEIPTAPKKKVAAVDTSKLADNKEAKKEHKNESDKKHENKHQAESKPKVKQEVANKTEPTQGVVSKLLGMIFGSTDKKLEAAPKVAKEVKPVVKSAPARDDSKQKPKQDDNKQNSRPNNKPKYDATKQNNDNQKPRHNNALKDNNQRPERSEKTEKTKRPERTNDSNSFKKDDKRSNNRNNNSNNRSSNINVNSAEEIVDITKLKYKSKTEVTVTDNIKKVISTNPEEFVSVMVKDVLENYDTLKGDDANQVTTEKGSKSYKYLRFETVSVDDELASREKPVAKDESVLVEPVATEIEKTEAVDTTVDVKVEVETEAKSKPTTKKSAPKKAAPAKTDATIVETKEKSPVKKASNAKPAATATVEPKVETKVEHLNYSPALDFESQGMV